MTFSIIDTIIVLIYIIIIFYIGFFASNEKSSDKKDYEEFLLAGRKLTIPIFVATLVATWYGNILGIGEFVYSSGILAWVCFCLPYYIAAAIYALFVAKKIRHSNVRTIPEQITNKFGSRAGYFSSVILLIITIPAAYILMLGIIIQLFTNWALWICIVTGALVSLIYLFKGGFKADVMTNMAQFIFMYLGFAVLLIFCMLNLGPLGAMLTKLPASHLKISGNNSWQLIIAWFIISLQTFVDPSFHQRCAAAKSPKTAQKGILISIGFWMIFDVMTLLTGLYARAYFSIVNPVLAYTTLGENILPVFWKGIFVVSLLATVMSSLGSYAFISAATIGNDILPPILRNRFKNLKDRTLIKFGLAITSIIAVTMAISLPSALQLSYRTSSIAVPGLLIPVIFSYSKKYKMTQSKVIMIMLISVFSSFFWYLGQLLSNEFHGLFDYFNKLEIMVPGIIISILLSLIFIKREKVNHTI